MNFWLSRARWAFRARCFAFAGAARQEALPTWRHQPPGIEGDGSFGPGDDADTTAAVVGQLAGAFYGAATIPEHWLRQLAMRREIQDFADRLLQLGV